MRQSQIPLITLCASQCSKRLHAWLINHQSRFWNSGNWKPWTSGKGLWNFSVLSSLVSTHTAAEITMQQTSFETAFAIPFQPTFGHKSFSFQKSPKWNCSYCCNTKRTLWIVSFQCKMFDESQTILCFKKKPLHAPIPFVYVHIRKK